MLNKTHTPKQMIAALKRVAALPGAEQDQAVLLDVTRVIAELTVAAFQVKQKGRRLHTERLTFDALAKSEAKSHGS